MSQTIKISMSNKVSGSSELCQAKLHEISKQYPVKLFYFGSPKGG